ncbi:uncharacterized protein B0H18DRAFT_358633 [Fomitopsis serialis]|uniref:uncharacterized protein n=1 Tax=Fomitopsis serialis TaxID=139415 RepID=UPI002007A365|nr:uncharacterized protein B0H18DRAFT_358633 [Neoantrodia serialis]KAH9925967.1 hypothetical protein B0H18DRAFT_358633 [Neoantrodia serialis]
MGDRCPRLELTIPTESTSFKRSFDELGLDLGSPNGERGNGGEGSGSGGERNKRARSESNARSPSLIPSSSNTLASGSSSSNAASSPRGASHEGSASSVDLMSDEPETLAEPMDGVEPLPPIRGLMPRTSPPTEQNDHFRLSMERFNAFDSNISVLRHSDSPMPGPSLPRSARTSLGSSMETSPFWRYHPRRISTSYLARGHPVLSRLVP